MGKDDDTLAGILLGILGLAALVVIASKNCPVCGKTVPRGTSVCPHCGSQI